MNGFEIHCSDLRIDLALYAGGDLNDPAQVLRVRQHAAHCPACARQVKQIRRSLSLLKTAPEPETYDSTTSVWGALSRQIRETPKVTLMQRVSNWQAWVPVASIAAACLVVAFAMTNGTTRSPTGELIPEGILTLPKFPQAEPTEPPKNPTQPGNDITNKVTPPKNR